MACISLFICVCLCSESFLHFIWAVKKRKSEEGIMYENYTVLFFRGWGFLFQTKSSGLNYKEIMKKKKKRKKEKKNRLDNLGVLYTLRYFHRINWNEFTSVQRLNYEIAIRGFSTSTVRLYTLSTFFCCCLYRKKLSRWKEIWEAWRTYVNKISQLGRYVGNGQGVRKEQVPERTLDRWRAIQILSLFQIISVVHVSRTPTRG